MNKISGIEKNFRVSAIIVVAANSIAAVLFLAAWSMLKNVAFLLLSILMVLSAAGFCLFLNYFKNKISGKM